MTFGKSMKYLLSLTGIAVIVGSLLAASAQSSAISEMDARELAIKQYRHLFSDKFYFNPVNKSYRPFPPLDASWFHKAQFESSVWTLAGDPPAGVFVYARVSADGKWVQLDRVGFAPE